MRVTPAAKLIKKEIPIMSRAHTLYQLADETLKKGKLSSGSEAAIENLRLSKMEINDAVELRKNDLFGILLGAAKSGLTWKSDPLIKEYNLNIAEIEKCIRENFPDHERIAIRFSIARDAVIKNLLGESLTELDREKMRNVELTQVEVARATKILLESTVEYKAIVSRIAARAVKSLEVDQFIDSLHLPMEVSRADIMEAVRTRSLPVVRDDLNKQRRTKHKPDSKMNQLHLDPQGPANELLKPVIEKVLRLARIDRSDIDILRAHMIDMPQLIDRACIEKLMRSCLMVASTPSIVLLTELDQWTTKMQEAYEFSIKQILSSEQLKTELRTRLMNLLVHDLAFYEERNIDWIAHYKSVMTCAGFSAEEIELELKNNSSQAQAMEANRQESRRPTYEGDAGTILRQRIILALKNNSILAEPIANELRRPRQAASEQANMGSILRRQIVESWQELFGKTEVFSASFELTPVRNIRVISAHYLDLSNPDTERNMVLQERLKCVAKRVESDWTDPYWHADLSLNLTIWNS
jgi:hypothetical protein